MANLYQIIDQYQQQLSQLQDSDLPNEVILDTIEAMQGDVETKLRAVVAYALQIKADAETRKAHAKRMAESAKAMENRAESLMMYAQVGVMNSGLKLPLTLPEFTLNLAKNPPSLEVVDEDRVPAQFKRRTCTFDIPTDWTDEHVAATLVLHPANCSSIQNYTIDEAVDKRPLLDAVKSEPEAHKDYAKLSPTSYRLTVR